MTLGSIPVQWLTLLEQILPQLNCVWLVSDVVVVSCFCPVDQVIPTGPSDPPTRPMVSKVATTSLRLKWLPPEFDGNSEITTYQVTITPPWDHVILHYVGGAAARRVD